MICLIIILLHIDVSLGGYVKITQCVASNQQFGQECTLSIDGIDSEAWNYWGISPEQTIHHVVYTLEQTVLLDRIRIVHGAPWGGWNQITSFKVEVNFQTSLT